MRSEERFALCEMGWNLADPDVSVDLSLFD